MPPDLQGEGLQADRGRGHGRGAGHAGPRLRPHGHLQAGLPGLHEQGPGRDRGPGAGGRQRSEMIIMDTIKETDVNVM